MAGPGMTGEQILYKQSKLIAKANGASEEEISQSESLMKKLYSAIKTGKDSTAISENLREILNNYYDSLSKKEKPDVEAQKEMIDSQIKSLTSLWFRYFLTYDPIPTLEKVKCPVIAINGSKDL